MMMNNNTNMENTNVDTQTTIPTPPNSIFDFVPDLESPRARENILQVNNRKHTVYVEDSSADLSSSPRCRSSAEESHDHQQSFYASAWSNFSASQGLSEFFESGASVATTNTTADTSVAREDSTHQCTSGDDEHRAVTVNDSSSHTLRDDILDWSHSIMEEGNFTASASPLPSVNATMPPPRRSTNAFTHDPRFVEKVEKCAASISGVTSPRSGCVTPNVMPIPLAARQPSSLAGSSSSISMWKH